MYRYAASLVHARWLRQVNRWAEPLILLGLLLTALLLFTLNLDDLPLRDWDEGTIAQVAREIYQSDPNSLGWLYPTLHGEPYYNKPTLVHSLIAIAYSWFGVHEWTTRLPGALFTAFSVPLLYGVGREVFVGRSPAVIAALVYLTTLPVVRHGRLAMLDGTVLCFMMVVMLSLLRSRRNPLWSLGIGIGLGLVALTKGMVAVLVGAIAFGFLVWDAPRLLTSLYLWIGIALGITPAIAWYAAQWLYYGQSFIDHHLFQQSFHRITESVDNNAAPPWYYLLELLKYGWPWLMILPQALHTAWHSHTMSWAKLGLMWGGGYFLAISLMSTKLPWYVLPVYPAIALLVAVPLSQIWQHSSVLSDGEKPSSHYPTAWSVILLLLALGGWGMSIYLTNFAETSESDPRLILSLIAIGLTMTVAAILVHQHDHQFISIMLWGMYVSLTLFMGSNTWVWELNEDYDVLPVAAMVRQETQANQVIYTSHTNRPSLNFYSDRQIVGDQSNNKLQRHWRNNDDPYLLLPINHNLLFELPQVQQVAQEDQWILIYRDRSIDIP